jgi:peptidoglycan/xylan/chitin deacetylase (PgdA/CDA1 family)
VAYVTSWAALAAELGEWRAARRSPELWWRDDDAAALTPPLERLLKLSQSSGVTVALAAIPLACEAATLENATCVLMHGCDHRNRAGAGEKKTEFAAAESDDAALERLAQARERLAGLAGGRFLPVLAPPWNRIRESLVARLKEAGLQGLSRYGGRRASGFPEVNTHVDLIAWRGDRGFIGEDEALELLLQQLSARRKGKGEGAEPIGILTHHALHDARAWLFLERLFEETRRGGAVWPHPAQLFASSTAS